MSPAIEVQLEAKKDSLHWAIYRIWLPLLIAGSIFALFWHFNAPALKVHLDSDDMMNTYYYWHSGAARLAVANLEFWSTYLRPLGGIYYLTLFSIFGLDPFPYNVTRVCLLALGAWMFYLLAVQICGSRRIAVLATLPLAYHAGMTNLAYDGAFIYDVLCGLFYFSSLFYYLRCRARCGSLGKGQALLFLGTYICALDSKEMAVSLPVIVTAYELVSAYGSTRTTRDAYHRVRAHVWPVLAVIAITIIFIYGKTHGKDALVTMPAYRPVFTWARFAESNTRFMNTIFYTHLFTIHRVIWSWAIILYIALRMRDRKLMLLWVWVVVGPLPIAFIPGRDNACLYIVTAAWAMIIASLCEGVARRLASEPILNFPMVPRTLVIAALLMGAAWFYVHETNWRWHYMEEAYLHYHGKTWDLIQQFRHWNFRPRHNSTMVFLNDPFPQNFNTLFIASLTWNDHTLQMWLQSHTPLPKHDAAAMDYLFDFQGGVVTCIKHP